MRLLASRLPAMAPRPAATDGQQKLNVHASQGDGKWFCARTPFATSCARYRRLNDAAEEVAF
eukprot:8655759-Alexandrium_andersonii.AAC.1